jgi:hypothetical protein
MLLIASNQIVKDLRVLLDDPEKTQPDAGLESRFGAGHPVNPSSEPTKPPSPENRGK